MYYLKSVLLGIAMLAIGLGAFLLAMPDTGMGFLCGFLLICGIGGFVSNTIIPSFHLGNKKTERITFKASEKNINLRFPFGVTALKYGDPSRKSQRIKDFEAEHQRYLSTYGHMNSDSRADDERIHRMQRKRLENWDGLDVLYLPGKIDIDTEKQYKVTYIPDALLVLEITVDE